MMESLTDSSRGFKGVLILGALTLLLLLAVAAPASADNEIRWVDQQDGSDAGDNNCLTSASPCATIGQAAAKSQTSDTIYVDDGQYNEPVTLSKGQTLSYLNFIVADSGGATIDGGAGVGVTIDTVAGAVVSGLRIRGDGNGINVHVEAEIIDNVFDDPDANSGISVQVLVGSAGTLLDGNEMIDPNPSTTRSRFGVYAPADNITVRDNYVWGMNVGIQTAGPGVSPSTIERNTVLNSHNQPVAGRAILAGANTRVVRNVIAAPFDTSTDGIEVASGVETEGNHVSGHRWGVSLGSDIVGVKLSNDVLLNSTQVGIWSFDSLPIPIRSSVTATNVTIWGGGASVFLTNSEIVLDSSIVRTIAAGTSVCTITYSRGNTITADENGCGNFSTTAEPEFVDIGLGDFRLAPGSPLIDAGNPAAPPEDAVDFDGFPRALLGEPGCAELIPGTRDIGAFEFVPELADCVAPNTKLAKKPKRKVTKKKVVFKLSSTEPGSTFQCKIDKKPWKPCAATVKFNVKVGKHTFQARATDEAGNTDASAIAYKFKRVKPKKKR